MTNENLKNKYNEVYSSGSKNFFTFSPFEQSHTIVSMGNWQNKTVLDIGCGEGELCSMISCAGASKVLGVDYSKEAINNANNKFNIKNLNFRLGGYKETTEKFDIITMGGVLEHFDSPWDDLKDMVENRLNDGGCVITSSPSFLNPRGYVWMTLLKLFDVPMSLTDLHYICPFDMKKFCEKNKYNLEYKSIYQYWGAGSGMISDFNKRLRNALRDAKMDNSKVDNLLEWLSEAKDYFKQDNNSGAVVVYKITK